MKIINLIPHLSGGGAERQLGYLAPELVRMGHDVHVAYSQEGPHKPDLPGVVLHRLTSRSSYDPTLLWQLIHLFRRIHPDIIQTWILQMDVLGGIAARFCGIPWIFREPSSSMAYPPNWKSRLRVRIGAFACGIVANSAGGDAYWREQLPASRRFVVLNGLPVSEIDRIAASLPPGLPASDAPIVLYAGRLASDGTATKNLAAFLEALACISQHRAVVGVLCGEGPQRTELELLRHQLGLDGSVYFTGHLPPTSVWALMKMATVFVSLSAYEGCPNTVMEAMAAGCPVVLSDIPAHREILAETSALFVDPADIRQTAAAIMQTVNDPDAAQKRSKIARQGVREWSTPEMARNYEKVYLELRNCQ